jgi:hypothetical protein
MTGGLRDRRGRVRGLGLPVALVAVVAIAVTACSDDPAPVDLIAEFDGRPRLTNYTGQLLDEAADDRRVATPEGRSSALAGEIADSVERARELLPDDPEAYLEATGARPASRFVVIGNTFGYTRAALDRIEEDGGDPVDTVGFALRLGSDLAERLEPGAGLDWVLSSREAIPRGDRDEIADLLADGTDGADRADREAARRLLDLVDDLGAAAVVDATVDELSSVVPVTVEFDLVTHLQRSYDIASETDGT